MKNNLQTFLGIIMLSMTLTAYSQPGVINTSTNASINATGTPANVSAMLDVSSLNKGILVPRVTLSTTISYLPIVGPPTNSLLVYNTTTAGTIPNNVVPGFYYWDGSLNRWVALGSGSGGSGNAWLLFGNGGTIPGTNFIGTTDLKDLVFKRGGFEAGRLNNSNTSWGLGCLISNTLGNSNTATGVSALNANTEGGENTANGYGALKVNTKGNQNTATGFSALGANITGGANTANGYNALKSNTLGTNNTASGWNALKSNTLGGSNTAYGHNALSSNIGNNNAPETGNGNTATGSQALKLNTYGNFNTAIGYNALSSNIYDFNNPQSGSGNTAIGKEALKLNTTGFNNTAVGLLAGNSMSTGNNNIIIGANQFVAITPNGSGSNELNIGGTIYGTAIGLPTSRIGIGTSSPNATLQVNGSISASAVRETGTSHNVSETDYFIHFIGGASSTMVLPLLTVNGRILIIANHNTGPITITNASYISGLGATTSIAAGTEITLIFDGTGWVRAN